MTCALEVIANIELNYAKRLFNLRHASFGNVFERIFGVVKRKFKILGLSLECSVDTQTHLVLDLVELYNFIGVHEDSEDEAKEVDSEISKGNEAIEPLVPR